MQLGADLNTFLVIVRLQLEFKYNRCSSFIIGTMINDDADSNKGFLLNIDKTLALYSIALPIPFF